MWEVIVLFSFIGCTVWVLFTMVLRIVATVAGDAMSEVGYRAGRRRKERLVEEYMSQGLSDEEARERIYYEDDLPLSVRKIYDRMISEGVDWNMAWSSA